MNRPSSAAAGREWPGRLLAVLLALLTVYLCVRAYRTSARLQHDFSTYYLASTDARTGANPYRDRADQSPFIYPPILLWLVSPLTRLDVQAAAVLWALATMTAWMLTVRLAVGGLQKLSRQAGAGPGSVSEPAPVSPLVWIVPSLITLRFILREFGLGQVNLIVLAVVTAAFFALAARREALAGTLVALGANLKILPLAFFLPLTTWRRWRALAAGALGLVFFLALPVVTYGPTRYAAIVDGFLHGRLATHTVDLAMDTHMANQSLFATASRWLTDVSPLPPGRPRISFAVAHLSLENVACLVSVVSLVLVGGCALALVRSAFRPELAGLGFSLVFVTIHLLSKKTWEEHLVSLLFVYTAILHAPGLGRRGAAVVGIAALLQWIHAPIFTGAALSDRIQALGPVTASLALLWAYLFGRLWVSRPA